MKKNEDEFSIQIVDMRERLQGFLKANLTEILTEPRTVMPSYSAAQLNDRALDDLLRYLTHAASHATRIAVEGGRMRARHESHP